jgi:hypothetical protein
MITAKTHAVLVARMRDGTIRFVTRLRRRDMLTPHRNYALVLTRDDAYETQQRLHAVQALGHYHQEVAFYDICGVKAPRPKATAALREAI